jgi:predicted amidophosphoribosyltransferase
MIPLYLFAGITSLAWWATRLFSRPKPGACPDCGYNLTGLAQEMVCPECGFNPELNVRKAARRELE